MQEDQIYSKGLQLNRYPFDSVVSTVLRAKPSLPVPLTALDLGSGTGNHLKFFAENGFDSTGIEQSISALNKSRQFLNTHDLDATLLHGDLVNLSNLITGNKYSFVLDRGSITHNPYEIFLSILDDVSSVLANGGIFMSIFFSDKHPSLVGALENILDSEFN